MLLRRSSPASLAVVALWLAAPKVALWLVYPAPELDPALPFSLDTVLMARVAVGLLGLYFILTAIVAIASNATALWMPPVMGNISVDAFQSQAIVNVVVNFLQFALGLLVFWKSERIARFL
jgi:hypothetical protein